MKLAYIFLVFLFSCATGDKGRIIKTQELGKIKKCVTTRQELEGMFGTDYDSRYFQVGEQSGYQTMRWSGHHFSHWDGTPTEQSTLLVFIKNDIIVDYSYNPVGTIVEIKNNCKN